MNDELIIVNHINEEDHSFSEFMFGYNAMLNEMRINRAYQLACCLENSNTEGLIQLNEGVIDSIKDGITKIWNKIVAMFNKFCTWLSETVSTDKGFLDKYKDVILKKKPIDMNAVVKVYDYNVKILYDTKVVLLGTEDIMNISSMNDAVEKATPTTMRNYKNDNATGIERMRLAVTGGKNDKSEIKMSQINFTDLYNYCYEYSNLKKQINEDLKNIQKVNDQLDNLVDKFYNKEIEPAPDVKTDSSNTEESKSKLDAKFNKATGKYEGSINIASFVNNPFISLLSEEESESPTVEINPSNAKNAWNSKGGNEANNRNVNYDDKVNSIDVKDNVNRLKNDGKDLSHIKSSINFYYMVCGEVIKDKLNLSKEIYKAYMSIMKYHVLQFTNKEKKQSDRSTPVSGNVATNNPNATETNNDNKTRRENRDNERAQIPS